MGPLGLVQETNRLRYNVLFGAPRAGVVLEGLTYLLKVYQGLPEAVRTRVKTQLGMLTIR
jgi:hypothetical protein